VHDPEKWHQFLEKIMHHQNLMTAAATADISDGRQQSAVGWSTG
jgi:hypothetical protein